MIREAFLEPNITLVHGRPKTTQEKVPEYVFPFFLYSLDRNYQTIDYYLPMRPKTFSFPF